MPEVSRSGPLMTIFAGPNGAGKSTLRELWNHRRSFGQIIDADALARKFHLSDVAAGRETVRMVQNCIDNGTSFSLETTLSGNLIFQQILQSKKQGFSIHLLYISLSSAFAHRKRVEQRVANGGHEIPAEDIERRYYRSHLNLPRAISVADYVDLFTNGTRCELIAKIEHGEMVEQTSNKPLWAEQALSTLAK